MVDGLAEERFTAPKTGIESEPRQLCTIGKRARARDVLLQRVFRVVVAKLVLVTLEADHGNL